MALFCNSYFSACAMAFIQTFMLWSLSSIAIELENPFGGDINDLDVQQSHSDFNDCLMMLMSESGSRVPQLIENRRKAFSISHSMVPLDPSHRRVSCRGTNDVKTLSALFAEGSVHDDMGEWRRRSQPGRSSASSLYSIYQPDGVEEENARGRHQAEEKDKRESRTTVQSKATDGSTHDWDRAVGLGAQFGKLGEVIERLSASLEHARSTSQSDNAWADEAQARSTSQSDNAWADEAQVSFVLKEHTGGSRGGCVKVSVAENDDIFSPVPLQRPTAVFGPSCTSPRQLEDDKDPGVDPINEHGSITGDTTMTV